MARNLAHAEKVFPLRLGHLCCDLRWILASAPGHPARAGRHSPSASRLDGIGRRQQLLALLQRDVDRPARWSGQCAGVPDIQGVNVALIRQGPESKGRTRVEQSEEQPGSMALTRAPLGSGSLQGLQRGGTRVEGGPLALGVNKGANRVQIHATNGRLCEANRGHPKGQREPLNGAHRGQTPLTAGEGQKGIPLGKRPPRAHSVGAPTISL